MPDKPASPFSGLDTALLRSTQRQAPTTPDQPAANIGESPSPSPDSRTSNRNINRSSGRSNERTTIRTNERSRIRHSFDIYQDQLLAMADIQAAIFRKTGRKPKMGELVQEALDLYIKKMNVRTNERPAE